MPNINPIFEFSGNQMHKRFDDSSFSDAFWVPENHLSLVYSLNFGQSGRSKATKKDYFDDFIGLLDYEPELLDLFSQASLTGIPSLSQGLHDVFQVIYILNKYHYIFSPIFWELRTTKLLFRQFQVHFSQYIANRAIFFYILTIIVGMIIELLEQFMKIFRLYHSNFVQLVRVDKLCPLEWIFKSGGIASLRPRIEFFRSMASTDHKTNQRFF